MTSRFFTILLAFAVIGLGMFAYTSRLRKQRLQELREPARQTMERVSAGLGNMLSQPAGQNLSVDGRFFCSQADQAGSYTVSFRGLRSDRAETEKLPAGFAPPGPLGKFSLFIQVTAVDELLPLRRLDTSSLRVIDSTGLELRPEEGVERLPEPLPFPGGHAYAVRMQPPSPSATSFRSIEGTLKGVGLDQDRPPLHFRITGIPLPNIPRLWGRASPLELDDQSASLKVLTGGAIEETLKRARPISVMAGLQPQRLLFGPGLPARVQVPDPTRGRPVQIQADPGPMGLIEVDVRQDSERWHGKVWDGDTVVVAPKGLREVLAIRITRATGPVPGPIESGSVFPPVDGSPAGMMISSVVVNGRPFGRGMMRVTLSHKEGDTWNSSRSSLISIKRDGSVVLPNLAPGEYRIERLSSGLTPYLPGIEQAGVDSYIRYRFGAVKGTWTSEKVDSVFVRAGQATRVPPLEWRSDTKE